MIDRVVTLADRAAVEEHVATDVLIELSRAISRSGRADIVLTGGTVGIGALTAIAHHPKRDTIDWRVVRVWWGDERFVASDNPERNDGQATTALLRMLPLPASNVFPFPADDGIALSVARDRFERTLRDEFDNQPHFDLVLCGIGPDGHVASLFPGREHGDGKQFVIGVDDSPKPPPRRLSLTFEALNRGDKVWIISAGADKAEAVARLWEGAPVSEVPATGLHGIVETALYVDVAAASRITR